MAATERSGVLRANYRDPALVFAELARNKTVWEAGLKGWNEMRSALVENWKAEARVDEARGLVVAQGTKWFGQPDAPVLGRLERITDEQELRRLALRLLDVENWGGLLER